MLEEPKIKKVDKRDKQLPQNFEQLIEMYDIEKIWPFILKTIQFINKEIPEDFKELIEKYELEDILKFFKSASKIMDFNASGKGMAIGKVSEENKLEIALEGELYEGQNYIKNLRNSYYFGVKNPAKWVYIGEFNLGNQGSYAVINCYFGNGQNGNPDQNTHAIILLKQGWTGMDLPIGVTTNYTQNFNSSVKIKILHTSKTSCKLYIYLPWAYNDLTITLDGSYNSCSIVNEDLSTEPTTDKESAYYDLTTSSWNGAYDDYGNSNLTYCSGGEIMPKGDISCSIWDKGGWTKIAGKLLVQWGEGNGISISANSVTDKTITFHQSFTKTPLVFIQPCGNYDIVGQVNNISNTNFLARIRNRNSSAVSDRWFNWFAIGI